MEVIQAIAQFLAELMFAGIIVFLIMCAVMAVGGEIYQMCKRKYSDDETD